jgi:hypothetical protein
VRYPLIPRLSPAELLLAGLTPEGRSPIRLRASFATIAPRPGAAFS